MPWSRTEGGITIDDAVVTAKLCEAAGANAINVSAYGNVAHAIAFTEAPLVHEPGGFDCLAMGRKLLADPELPNKLAANAPQNIRPCIYCYICVSQIFINQPMMCAVNHSTGWRNILFALPPLKPFSLGVLYPYRLLRLS